MPPRQRSYQSARRDLLLAEPTQLTCVSGYCLHEVLGVVIAHGNPRQQTAMAVRADGLQAGMEAFGLEVSRIVVAAEGRRWHRRPRQWWYFRRTTRLGEQLRADLPSDTAIVLMSYLPIAALTLRDVRRQAPKAFCIYDAHNDEVSLARQRSGRWNTRYVSRMERVVVDQVDAVTVAGSEDLAVMRARYPGRAMANIPQAVDASEPGPRSALRARSSLLLTGNWKWWPNSEGLCATCGRSRCIR